jgi:ABC-type uncharacterized transport system substrate-binding protein
MRNATAFFLPRVPVLLKRKVLLSLLKAAHLHKVAVFSFSGTLVKAGALAALVVTPEQIGRLATERLLKLPQTPMDPKLVVNKRRAAYLGITIPPKLLHRLR